MMMTLRNNSGTGPSSPNPPAVVYRDVAVAGGALLPLHTYCSKFAVKGAQLPLQIYIKVY